MREILYRGKRLDTKQWEYGNYNNVNGKAYIFPEDAPDSYDNYQVDHDTVGQYTGLTDKNGNKIFEGDILVSETIMHKIVWNDEWAKFQAISESIYSPSSLNQEWINMYGKVVIGNIHDNPELLKGSEK